MESESMGGVAPRLPTCEIQGEMEKARSGSFLDLPHQGLPELELPGLFGDVSPRLRIQEVAARDWKRAWKRAWSTWPHTRRKTMARPRPDRVESTLPCGPLSTDPALLPFSDFTWSPQDYFIYGQRGLDQMVRNSCPEGPH